MDERADPHHTCDEPPGPDQAAGDSTEVIPRDQNCLDEFCPSSESGRAVLDDHDRT